MTNTNYSTFVGTATQLQRWRDFLAHLAAYVTVNLLFIGMWLATRGPFWPVFSLLGWGIGLSFQHFVNALAGPITDGRVRAQMTTAAPDAKVDDVLRPCRASVNASSPHPCVARHAVGATVTRTERAHRSPRSASRSTMSVGR